MTDIGYFYITRGLPTESLNDREVRLVAPLVRPNQNLEGPYIKEKVGHSWEPLDEAKWVRMAVTDPLGIRP